MDTKLTSAVQKRTNGHNRRQENNWCRASTIILIVLLVCGLSALGLSAIVWHFYEYFEGKTEPTTASPTTTHVPLETTTTLTTTTMPTSTKRPQACGKRIVGFYTENESGEITQNQLEKLTHAVFEYMEMTFDGDIGFRSEKGSRRFSSLKNRANRTKSDLKGMISIGGENNSEHFASVSVDKPKRTTFVSKIASFLQEHNIDGVNIYWARVTENDKWKYIKLLKDLRGLLSSLESATNKQYLISITVPPISVRHEEMAYDVDQILEYVDFINVISMNYDGSNTTEVGPIAPLFSNNSFNVDSTMRYYVCKTGKPKMFNIVVPSFTRFWGNVEKVGEHHFKTSHPSMDKSRFIVKEEGRKLAPISWDDGSKSAYVYNQDSRTILALESDKSVQAKVDYLNKMKLGGVWIWSVDMDDDTDSLLDNVYCDELCSVQEDNTNIFNFCS